MSTGAWIFTGLICTAVIAPASVYAAAVAKTQLVGSTQSHVAGVTAQGQLLATAISPSHVVRIGSGSLSGCASIYTPPAGKAIVVTSVTYTAGSGTAGVEYFGGLGPASCTAIYDQIDGVAKFDTIQHTFPSGLPMSQISLTNNGAGLINVFIVGYLIDATSLPSAALSHVSHNVKASSGK
jgi:hypothetical protein